MLFKSPAVTLALFGWLSIAMAPSALAWGAIAIGEQGSIGVSFDHTSEAAATQEALAKCPEASCTIRETFSSTCVASVFKQSDELAVERQPIFQFRLKTLSFSGSFDDGISSFAVLVSQILHGQPPKKRPPRGWP